MYPACLSTRGSWSCWGYSSRFVSMAQMIRADLLAMATVASRNGFSASSFAVHVSVFSGLFLAISARDVIPMISSFRMYRSPFLVIRPSRSRPPLDLFNGVKPNHAAKSRPVLNCFASPIVATTAEAVIGPMPGIRIKRRASAFSHACRSISLLSPSIRIFNAVS